MRDVCRRLNVKQALLLLCTSIAYAICVSINVLSSFHYTFAASPTALFQWMAFGLSESIGLLFLGIGVLVWFYARNRRVALLFYCFCCASAIKFSIQGGYITVLGAWLSLLATLLSLLFVLLLFIYLLFSPAFRTTSIYIRQHVRLFVGSAIFSLAPLLVLTALPELFKFPGSYIIDVRFASISLSLFPVTLAYSILRYQLSFFESSIRRSVTWVVGCICLTVFAYTTLLCFHFILPSRSVSYVISVVACAVVLAPFAWWLAKIAAEQLLFSEGNYYRRLIEEPTLLEEEILDIEEASRLFTLAATQIFETSQVCLFIVDESTNLYRLCPPLRDDPEDGPRQALLLTLQQALGQQIIDQQGISLDVFLPIVERLASARRPLLLNEVTGLSPAGLDRYIAPIYPELGEHVLLAPVYAPGKVIGILVLGEHAKHQRYAGTDFEIAQLLVSRFASMIENARLYARASKYSTFLNSLCSVDALLDDTFKMIDEVAYIYASVVAESASARAEIWLYDKQEHVLERIVSLGAGPRISPVDVMHPVQGRDWSSLFCEGSEGAIDEPKATLGPSCLPRVLPFSLAWLPLLKGEQQVGVLVLTYASPHFFLKEEARALEMFATQCAAALENARMTMALYNAHEQQTELDHLKDQFIIIASHELRIPLIKIEGYLDLLIEYSSTLDSEMRSNFIAKARRGCDELTLLVGNIMDASQVQVAAEKVRLCPLSLHDAATYVLAILETAISREQRGVDLTIASDLFVLADQMCLHQVLLNLLANALKYSPPRTQIVISASVSEDWVTAHIQDSGLGVPPDAHQSLFERFVRLERDRNGPVHGAGLGLFICRQLIRSMGGQIWVESSGQPGKGSIFSFTLRRSPRPSSLLTSVERQAHQVSLPALSPSTNR